MTRRSFVVLLAFVVGLGASRVLLAHEGHGHKVMGTVTTIHENHLEVKDKAGKITTHELGTKTKIRRGKAVLTAAEIKAGDRVVVTFVESKDKAGKVVKTVTQVDVGTPVATTAAKQ